MTKKPSNQKKRRKARSTKTEHWIRQCNWLVDIMSQLHEMPSAHGLKWTKGMLDSYKRQFDELAKQTPPRCGKHRDQCAAEIDAILSNYTEMTEQ